MKGFGDIGRALALLALMILWGLVERVSIRACIFMASVLSFASARFDANAVAARIVIDRRQAESIKELAG